MVHTLELLQHPAIADAWHNVTAPGGYEWWYFDAEDVEQDRQIVAILFDGCVCHPGYLRKYFWYARRPTRVAPPLPNEYLCAYFAVYHAGKIEQDRADRVVKAGVRLLEPALVLTFAAVVEIGRASCRERV